MLPLLRTKIVCTIGPASREPEQLGQLIRAGMDVARLNFSHGDHATHAETIRRVREAASQAGKAVAILGDLQGPKLRVGVMQEGGVPITAGETLVMTTDDIVGGPGRVPVQYELLPQVLAPGDRILIDDGLLEVKVERDQRVRDRHQGRDGRRAELEQGHEPAPGRAEHPGHHRQGPRGPRLCDRAGDRLDGAVVCAHQPGGVGPQGVHPPALRVRPADAGDLEDREARGDREHRRHHRGVRRDHGRAWRPGHRALARGRPDAAETDHRQVQRGWESR